MPQTLDSEDLAIAVLAAIDDALAEAGIVADKG
jgi:hypothetical protein